VSFAGSEGAAFSREKVKVSSWWSGSFGAGVSGPPGATPLISVSNALGVDEFDIMEIAEYRKLCAIDDLYLAHKDNRLP
jgi:hypothetical protein